MISDGSRLEVKDLEEGMTIRDTSRIWANTTFLKVAYVDGGDIGLEYAGGADSYPADQDGLIHFEPTCNMYLHEV